MSNKFKAGDKVRCVDNDNGTKAHIKVGDVYEVDSLLNGAFVVLKDVPGDYYPYRFEKLRPTRFRILPKMGHPAFDTADEAQAYIRENFSAGAHVEVLEAVSATEYEVTKTLRVI